MKRTIFKLVIIFVLILVVPPIGCDGYTIEITSPEDKDDVNWRYWVEGETSLPANSGYNIYVLIMPIDSSLWYVQPKASIDPDGTWDAYIYFGREGMDRDTWYRVRAIITSSNLDDGDTFSELPGNVAKSDSIRVRRV